MPFLTKRKLREQEISLVCTALQYYYERVNWSENDAEQPMMRDLRDAFGKADTVNLLLPKE